MKIIDSLSMELNGENRNMKYFYRVIEGNILNSTVYGIEVERHDFINGKVVNLERDYIKVVSDDKEKVADIAKTLCNHLVSPIHLIDIVGEYSDEYVMGLK